MAGRTEGSSALQDEGPNITMTSGGASGDGVPQPQSLGYRNIMQSINDSMRSDFTGQAVTPKGESPEARRSKIQMNLRNAEDSASSQGSTSGLDAQSGENNVSSGFTNNVGKGGSVQGNSQNKDSDSKGGRVKGGGFFKKKGPLVSIILSLVFGGGGMYMSQAALPFTMLDKLNGLFDTTNVSTEMRSKGFMKSMMRNSKANPTAVTKTNMFGREKFKPSGKMKRKLAKNGITFEGGNMIYKNKSGASEVLSVSDFKAKLDTDSDFRAAYTSGTKNWRTSVAEFKDKMFNKILDKFGLSKNRFKNYNAEDDPDGSKARETMAGDADDATDGKTKTRGESSSTDSSDETKKVKNADGSEGETTERKKSKKISESESTDTMKSKDTKAVSEKLGKISAVAGAVTSIGCGITKAISALSLILSAYQLMQVIAVAQEIFEGVDKARTEDANSSPINAIGKSLTIQESETRTVTDQGATLSLGYTTGTASNDDGDEEEFDKAEGTATEATYKEQQTAARSAVQSEGFSSLYTGDTINPDNESVLSFIPTRAANQAISDGMGDIINEALGPIGGWVNSIMGFVGDISGLSMDKITSAARDSYIHCIQVEAGLAILDMIIDGIAVAEAILGIFTFGTTTAAAVAQIAAKEALKAALMAVIGLAISALVAAITPFVVNMFTRKMLTTFAGEDLGNAIYSGGSALMSSNHRAGGGVVANKSGYLASIINSEKVNIETGKNERLARSPFDYTSAYTFAGQLASTMIPITLQSDSLLDSFGKFGSVVRNSIGTFLPGASAASAAEKANYAQDFTNENCEDLANIGGVADSFCNPYITTDFSTIEIDDSEDETADDTDPNSAYNIMKEVDDLGGFEESDIDSVENPTIDLDSNLGKFVVYCGQRSSQFGQPDQNIAAEVESGHTGSTLLDAGVNIIPVAGGLMSLIQSGSVLANFGWVDGSNCVMDHDMTEEEIQTSKSSSTKVGKVDYQTEIKYYSRYAEDQRLAAAMGTIEESAVDVALDKYYAEHPLDNSPEGVLARFTGLTKENVIVALDMVDFYSWLAHYDPTDYYPTPAVHKEDPDYRIEDDRMIQDDGILAVIRAGFETFYRQRNFATA